MKVFLIAALASPAFAFAPIPAGRHSVALSASAYSASDLLYQDQQDARARRAAVEQELLGNNIKPLKAPKTKKVPVKPGSGFGSGKQDTRTPSQRLAAEQRKIVDKDGVLRIDHVLSTDLCDGLRKHVLRQQRLAEEETAKNVAVSTEYYGVENRRKKRCDLLLSLVPDAGSSDDSESDPQIIPDVLQHLLGSDGTLQPIYQELVTNDGELYEFATVITDPGSDRQQIHPDLPYRKIAPLYVIFLALQDVTEEMGPTSFLLGTHTYDSQVKFEDYNQKDELLQNANARHALLKKGDAVLFDARVLHCGNANSSEEDGGATRAMFNFSFRNPQIGGDLGYCGSMRPGYVGALTLGDIGEALEGYGQKGDTNPFEKYGSGLINA